MQLVLDTKGLRLEKKRNTFLISVGEEVRSISPKKVSSIAITAEVLIEDAELEPMPKLLSPTDWEEVKSTIIKQVKTHFP